MNSALGICYYPHFNYIDHIVPLCQILNFPLLCSDPTVEQVIKAYYPSMDLIYEPDIQGAWEKILDGYEVLIYTEFYRRFHGAFEFMNFVYSKEKRSIYCPHGNSDKGQRSFWMERFADEDITLIYGPKMRDFLINKGVWDRLKKPIEVGNFRYAYYQKYKNFFDPLIESELFPSWRKKNEKKNLLYVPTWQMQKVLGHYEWDSSSFFSAHPFLFKNIPKEYRLFVKLHPNLYIYYKKEIEEILEEYREYENIHFIEECPLIYPLLAQMDAYIGDLSSIGYDFLALNRPMFFLNSEKRDPEKDPGLYLYRCGIEISPENFSNFYKFISPHLEDSPYLKNMRAEIYEYSFGNKNSLESLHLSLNHVKN